MSRQSNEGASLAGLREVIDDLQADGWTVQAEEMNVELPEILRNWRIDIVARRGDEILFGEVASRRSAKQERLDELARRVARIPNARFEVFWIGNSSDQSPPASNVLAYVREATDILEASPRAALVLAWSAVEAAVVMYAEQSGMLGGWNSPWQLLNRLFSDGLVSGGDFARLSTLWKTRGEIVHRASAQLPTTDDIHFLADIAEGFALNRYTSAGTMIDWFLARYESPAEKTPYDSKEGGYQYLGRGPHDARLVLSEAFPNATGASRGHP
jgi:Holliday junction resolvase-like predicted endonuclease